MWASIGSVNPAPVTAWLVRSGSPASPRGRLTLERHSLTFTPDADEDPLPIPTNRIRKVRRRRGTPILEVTYTDARTEPRQVFLYFAQPPPLPTHTGRGSLFRPTRGMERTASAMALRARAQLVRERLDEWVAAVRDAAGLKG
jgi:hypothetical protein